MKETKFNQFDLKPFIHKAIDELGFYKPTTIQERLIPSIQKGESVIGQSQTGTGKTHSFLLPILNKIDPTKNEVQAVITAPTRELAQQIHDEVLKITKHCDKEEVISSRLLIGGTDRLRLIDKLKTQPQVVVGTPGRIFDLVKEQALIVYTSTVLVVDEADLAFDMGLIEDIDQVASRMPENLQILVFSATIPEKLKPFLKKYMENPKFTHVVPKQATAENIEQLLVPLRHREKIDVLTSITKIINPYLAIVFVNTKKEADILADELLGRGIKTGRIHGDLTPRERKKMMRQVRDLEYQFVVATDLAARGIDIEGVSHVINYQIPKDLEFFIHRVGRTARAGHSGVAVTIYEPSDEPSIEKLEEMGIDFKHVDYKNNDWIDLGHRNKRKKRTPQEDETVKNVHKMIKKPKKVKPGYKKKRKAEIDKVIRQKTKRNYRGK